MGGTLYIGVVLALSIGTGVFFGSMAQRSWGSLGKQAGIACLTFVLLLGIYAVLFYSAVLPAGYLLQFPYSGIALRRTVSGVMIGVPLVVVAVGFRALFRFQR